MTDRATEQERGIRKAEEERHNLELVARAAAYIIAMGWTMDTGGEEVVCHKLEDWNNFKEVVFQALKGKNLSDESA